MKTVALNSIGALGLCLGLVCTLNLNASAQGTAFTFQGRLESGGVPYTGLAEFQFSLWDAASAGSQEGSTLTVSGVGVTNGLFTVTLDFGDQFPGADRWLEIAVRTNLLGFTTLAPRQKLTATPYAATAGNVTGTLSASQLSGTIPSGALGNAWQIGGNAGTTAGTHFLGTSDDQPLELKVNGVRALRLEPSASGAPNVIGGAPNNSVAPGVVGATLGGGYLNTASANYSTVGGGYQNTASGPASTVGGGQHNAASARDSTVGGGQLNTASVSASTVGGGQQNTASGEYSTVGGGSGNTASGLYATVPGGLFNSAARYAFAAGRRAKANHNGAFVWGDSTDADIASTTANSVTFRASGGYRLFSNSGATSGVSLASGSGSWTSLCDRNAKENFQPVNTLEVLRKVVALRLSTWNYKTQDSSIRHIGPTAQDFRVAFGLGESETGITGVDADGVALAAIQGLNQKVESANEQTAARIQKLESENAALRRELLELKELIRSLVAHSEEAAQ